MKSKILNFLLLITSLLGYLEWGRNNHLFLFQAEGEIIFKLFTEPAAVLHPLILLPLTGQVILLITLFQKAPGRTWTYISLGCLGILFVLLLAIGLMGLNYKTTISAVPFLIISVLAIRHYKKTK